eukprot:242355_1
MNVEWSTIAFAVYLGLTVLLVILLGIKAYHDNKASNKDKLHKKEFLETVWSMKSIYGTVLVHLYDTSTDIGVLVAWSVLAYNELSNNDPVSSDVRMLPFLIPACVLLFLHRIVFMIYYYTFLHDTDYFEACDMIWILSDTYILKIAYESFQQQYTEPCVMQKNLQLWESVFESMPQLVLQTVFLIKTNQSLSNDADMILIFLSITASIISVLTKYMWYDRNWVASRAQSVHFKYKKCKFPYCISYSYVARSLWRFSELMLRFIIFSLIWTVLGGVYLGIYLIINWLFYYLLEIYTKATWITLKLATKSKAPEGQNHETLSQSQFVDTIHHLYEHNADIPRNVIQTIKSYYLDRIDESFAMIAIIVLQSMIGIPLRHHLKMNMIRFLDNLIFLALVAVVSLHPDHIIECESDMFCNNTDNKYASNNGYIRVLLVVGGIALVLELVIYLAMYVHNVLTTEIGHSNYKLEDVKDNKFGLTKNEQLLRQFHPMFLKRAKQQQCEELGDVLDELDQIARDREAGFGSDLDVGDVAFNPMASGVPLPIRRKDEDKMYMRMNVVQSGAAIPIREKKKKKQFRGINAEKFRATSVSNVYGSNYSVHNP